MSEVGNDDRTHLSQVQCRIPIGLWDELGVLRRGYACSVDQGSSIGTHCHADDSALRECHESRGTRYSERLTAQNDASAWRSSPLFPRRTPASALVDSSGSC